MMRKRTAEGVAPEGSAFEPYSDAYKKAREKKGWATDRVDLRSTGEMLVDLEVEVNAAEKTSEIFFKK